jgi:peroxiredoxin
VAKELRSGFRTVDKHQKSSPTSDLPDSIASLGPVGYSVSMKLGAIHYLLMAVTALSLSLIAFSPAPAGSQSKINYKVVPILQPMKDNAPTPDFTLTTPEGKKLALKDFRGKVVLLNFWASWCVPCREEMPAMEKLYQEFKQKNFAVLAVAVKDRKQDAIDFVKELKITYPIAFDPDAQVGTLYGAWGLPATYLIGPKGEGLARGWGPAEWYNQATRKLIQDLVDGKR